MEVAVPCFVNKVQLKLHRRKEWKVTSHIKPSIDWVQVQVLVQVQVPSQVLVQVSAQILVPVPAQVLVQVQVPAQVQGLISGQAPAEVPTGYGSDN